MALITALLPKSRDRDLLAAALPTHTLLWAASWRDLQRHVRLQPAGAAVVDLHAEPRIDGALRVLRFTEKFPLTPVIVWGDLEAGELVRVGKARAADVLLAAHAEDATLVGETIEGVLAPGIWAALEPHLAGRITADALGLVRETATRIPLQIQVPQLAELYQVSVSTLERRCERWNLPSPGRLLMCLRVLHALRWLAEPGRSVESVAGQLGYSSGAALRRAVRATVGDRLDNRRGRDLLPRAVALMAFEVGAPSTQVA